jgi:hypothetical protein
LAKDEHPVCVIDQQREMQKDYEKNFIECLERGKKAIDGDFYLVVETKKERLLVNVLRNYFFYRHSCPTPTYDTAVYKYHRSSDTIEFLWTVPSRDTCELLRDNALEVAPEERDLLHFVLDFYQGTLLARAKKMNNEQAETSLLQTA